ncbi:hypothetical protein ELD05_10765 [Caldicellulosiruptor changbaiensis]|uniref:Transposase IS116/IS110/IS902 C-terminal domain-containing protein n=1 Tax=Caldicellulosiruptor changbaiensis TaxID=1222016 RepID=A0A3T0D931_9FIRM|nr:transposase [Caldicellulosiruptor changbaiensis]AZT91691.1 hypothetical protein ELD05_10765 [Caldicellulosiruptor changbaiensis]
MDCLQNKLVAYFGLTLSVVQSWQFVGTKNKISKRGSEILRRVLFCGKKYIQNFLKTSCF